MSDDRPNELVAPLAGCAHRIFSIGVVTIAYGVRSFRWLIVPVGSRPSTGVNYQLRPKDKTTYLV